MKLNQFKSWKTLALIIFIIILLIYYHNIFETFHLSYRPLNSTNFIANAKEKTENDVTQVNRIKRFLIFQGGGVVKLVLGTSFPIKMADKKRSLNYFYNFQMQYPPPTIPLYSWSIYNTSTFAARKHSKVKLIHLDNSRDLVYKFIKTALTRTGNSANKCLLNVICKLADVPFFEDFGTKRGIRTIQENINAEDNDEIEDDSGRNMYHKLFNAVFVPTHSNVGERYLYARNAGKNGADCNETFGKCSIVEKLLEKYTRFV